MLPQIDDLTDVNEPELVDGGDGPAIFFYARRFWGGGEDCALVGGTRAGTRPAPTGAFEGEGEDGAGGDARAGQSLAQRGFDGTGGTWGGGTAGARDQRPGVSGQ